MATKVFDEALHAGALFSFCTRISVRTATFILCLLDILVAAAMSGRSSLLQCIRRVAANFSGCCAKCFISCSHHSSILDLFVSSFKARSKEDKFRHSILTTQSNAHQAGLGDCAHQSRSLIIGGAWIRLHVMRAAVEDPLQSREIYRLMELESVCQCGK